MVDHGWSVWSGGKEDWVTGPKSICKRTAYLYRLLYGLHLNGHHGEDLHADAIELVKAAPGTRLGESFVNVATRFVVHLLRAVEDINHYAQGASEVLGGLRFPSSRGTSGCPGQPQSQRLRRKWGKNHGKGGICM